MAAIAKLCTKDIHGGLVLTVRVSRVYRIRTRLALWLIQLAGRVMDMPTAIQITDWDVQG